MKTLSVVGMLVHTQKKKKSPVNLNIQSSPYALAMCFDLLVFL